MLGQTHRLDEDRPPSLDLERNGPGFREGDARLRHPRPGGLVVADPANPGNEVADTEEAKRRIAGALVLLNSVLDRAAPRQRLRKEKGGGLDDVSTALGFQQVALQEAQNLHHHMAGIFEDRSAKLENADKTGDHAVAQRNAGSRGLVSGVARVQQLSLPKFL